ncbi:hypothetical protein OAR96_02835 [Euryarchaeota archaeon]|nr:hypothetical protein [Euryarchaeota archaeon]
MKDDIVLQLLKQVKSGKVSIEDARSALEGVDLSEEILTGKMVLVGLKSWLKDYCQHLLM